MRHADERGEGFGFFGEGEVEGELPAELRVGVGLCKMFDGNQAVMAALVDEPEGRLFAEAETVVRASERNERLGG